MVKNSELIVITGGTKGLGAMLCEGLISRGKKVVSLARTRGEVEGVDYITCDLGSLASLSEVISDLFLKINIHGYGSVTLINNAGIITPIQLLGELEAEGLIKAINVNLLAPMLLSNSFIKLTKEYSGKRSIINLTSGAALKPLRSWSTYSSAKAGLDAFSLSLKADLGDQIRVVSIDPGVLDTQMQREIRSANSENFPDVKIFESFKSDNKLASPKLAAETLIEFFLDDTSREGRFFLPEFYLRT